MASTENLRSVADFVSNITGRLRGISIDDNSANELFDLPSLLTFSSKPSTESQQTSNFNENTFNWIIKRIIIRTRVLWPEQADSIQNGEVFAEESQLLATDWSKITDMVDRFGKFDLMFKSNQIDIFIDCICRAFDLCAPVLQSIEIRTKIALFCLVTISVLASESAELPEFVASLAKLTTRVVLAFDSNSQDVSAFVNGAFKNLVQLSPFEAASEHINLEASKSEANDDLQLWPKLQTLLANFHQKSAGKDFKPLEPTLLLPQTNKTSTVQLCFLAHFLNQILASTTADALQISSSLSQLTECIQTIVAQKNIQAGYNAAYLLTAIDALLRVMKRSYQNCFFNGRLLCEGIKAALCKSPSHFQTLYSSYLKLLRFVFSHMEDQEWLKRHWQSGDMSNHLTIVYNASVKPTIDYVTSDSAKLPKNKGNRLNTSEKLVCEVELMTLEPEAREQLLVQFLKLLSLLLKKEGLRTDCSQWTVELSKFTRHVICNGANFQNLSQKVARAVARFLTLFADHLRHTDIDSWNRHKYSLLDFALTRLGEHGKELQESLRSSASTHQLIVTEPPIGSPSIDADAERCCQMIDSRREFTFGLESKVISVESDSQRNLPLTKTVSEPPQNAQSLFFTFSREKDKASQVMLSNSVLPENLSATMPLEPVSFKRVKTSDMAKDSSFFKSVIEKTAKKK